MSEIKAGDLVMVVRGHKCVVEAVGCLPFVVDGVHTEVALDWKCRRCGEQHIKAELRYVKAPSFSKARRGVNVPVTWLQKLDPPAQSETIERKEELTA